MPFTQYSIIFVSIAIPLSLVYLKVNLNVVKVGQSVTFECSAYSRPRANITWFKDGKLINPSVNMTNSTNSNDILAKSMFTIKYMEPSYQSVYTCRANNMINSQPVTSNPQTISKYKIAS